VATTVRQYARFADDLVILVDSYPRQQWFRQAVERRLREELAELEVEMNEEKSRKVDYSEARVSGFSGLGDGNTSGPDVSICQAI
jgi:RNA-directed DNA polymerase